MRSRRQSLVEDQSAAAYVEFLVAFLPMFTLFLGIFQTSLMFTAKVVVQHSANMAARSAIVIIPEDPKKLDTDTNRDSISFEVTENKLAQSIEKVKDGLQKLQTGIAVLGVITGRPVGGSEQVAKAQGWLDQVDAITNFQARGDERMRRIQKMAGMPLLGFAPPANVVLKKKRKASMLDALMGTSNKDALLATGLLFNRMGVAVTFPSAPGAAVGNQVPELLTFVDENGAPNGYDAETEPPGSAGKPLTVRVTYLYACSVPLVRWMMCPYGMVHVSGNSNIGQAANAELDWALNPGGRWLTTVLQNFDFERGVRFYPLRAESTMVYQYAPYKYCSESPDLCELD